MKLGELFIQLGVKSDLQALKLFNTALKDVTVGALGTIAGVAGVSLAFKDMFNQAMATSLNLEMFAAKTGQSTIELQKWQNVAELSNVSTEGVSASIESLTSNIAKIKMGGGNLVPFQVLGINPSQSPFAILEQLRNHPLMKKDRPRFMDMMTQLGFTPDMILLLQKTNKEFQNLSRPELIISESGQRKLLNTQLEIRKFRMEVIHMSNALMVQLTPAFVAIGHGVENLMEMFSKMIDHIKISKEWAITFAAALGIIGFALFPITSGLLLLLAVMEDIYGYTQGKISLTGAVMKQMDKMEKQPGLLGDTIRSAKTAGNAYQQLSQGSWNIFDYLAGGLTDIVGTGITGYMEIHRPSESRLLNPLMPTIKVETNTHVDKEGNAKTKTEIKKENEIIYSQTKSSGT